MLTNFSPNAQLALSLARKEADRLKHDYVGTGHLLLGLLRLERGGALEILVSLDLATRAAIGAEVERLLSLAQDGKVDGFIPYTAHLRHVFVHAGRESHHHHHAHVGTEHLLLGLFQEYDGAAAKALRTFGFDLDRLRQELQRLHPALTTGANA